MAFEPLKFTKNWENSEDFPTYEPDEAQVRADLQWLHNETRDAINRLIEALNEPEAAAQLPFQPQDGLTAQTVQAAILEVYAAIQNAAAGLLVDGTVSKEKLTEALLERIYGGRVWVGLDTPGPEHNPDTDFPLGQLWLRPGFTVENLLQNQWTVSGCTMEADGSDWVLTADGTAAAVSASQCLENMGKAGQRVLVSLYAAELDDHLSELNLYLNGVEQDLMAGGGVFETALDQSGSLELTVSGAWPYAEAEAAVRLSRVAVINTDAVDSQIAGCHPLSDWAAFLEAHTPFDQTVIPQALFLQAAPGSWTVADQEILPVSRGGTGLNSLSKGQLLYAKDDGALTVLNPPAEADSLLVYNGAPQWKTKSQTVETLGQLQLTTGTYTGTAAAGTVALPVAPKLLHIFPESGIDTTEFSSEWTMGDMTPAVLADGTEAAQVRKGTYTSNDTTYTGTWGAKVKLSGKTLTFSIVGGSAGVRKADYMNRSGVTYRWTALY